ncbi:chemoreceptor glutamine deamidase CheD [Litoribrevibacter albus]|uniref:Probable chemoreceptor glutamine deamidase CheD n=1 Tax=Litoribrevibacter albus TaxID=1473156 RepID=A0AA37W8E3_9GAMM|nr:chemoreceptor glutamine deamidase CheD [Litoribrevibacter albus]GLQ32338.1 putative chemoreceptor glutamine deamidase CheD [Litoribrevibacter albus]
MLCSLKERPELPPVLPGFDHIKRFWDPKHQVYVAKILPGEFYVSGAGEVISTVLGSCVSACVRDPVLRIGGMNHFMLPVHGGHSSVEWEGAPISSETRYGNWAMEYLINELLKAGAARDRLEIKVFGGGQVLANMTDVGAKNIHFIETYLASEGMKIMARDLGGVQPRKVMYFTDTGKVLVKRITRVSNDTIASRERDYMRRIDHDIGDTKQGSIELFD